MDEDFDFHAECHRECCYGARSCWGHRPDECPACFLLEPFGEMQVGVSEGYRSWQMAWNARGVNAE